MFGYQTDTFEFAASIMVTLTAVWVNQFLSDVLGLTTSLTVSGWFFTRDKTRSAAFPGQASSPCAGLTSCRPPRGPLPR